MSRGDLFLFLALATNKSFATNEAISSFVLRVSCFAGSGGLGMI